MHHGWRAPSHRDLSRKHREKFVAARRQLSDESDHPIAISVWDRESLLGRARFELILVWLASELDLEFV